MTPDLPKALLLQLYRFLRLARSLDERLSFLEEEGGGDDPKDGSSPAAMGSSANRLTPGRAGASPLREAVSVGSALALDPGDLVALGPGNLGAALVRGLMPLEILLHRLGRDGRPQAGKDTEALPMDLQRGVIGGPSIPGALLPIATGVLLAARRQGKHPVALAFAGLGATSTGDFHEALSFASVQRLALVVVVESEWLADASHGPPAGEPAGSKKAKLERLADRAFAYGIPSAAMEAQDVLAVFETTRLAVERARRAEGPVLLEAVASPAPGLANRGGVSYAASNDPIERFRSRMLSEAAAALQELDSIDRAVESELLEVERLALAALPPRPDSALDGVTATNPLPAARPF